MWWFEILVSLPESLWSSYDTAFRNRFSSADGQIWFHLKIATSMKIVICFALGLKFNILHIRSLKKSSELLWKICNQNLSSLKQWDQKMAQSENSSEKPSQSGKKYIISGRYFNRISIFLDFCLNYLKVPWKFSLLGYLWLLYFSLFAFGGEEKIGIGPKSAFAVSLSLSAVEKDS